MTHQNRSHSERSVAVGEGGGDTESKNPVSFRESFPATIGRPSDIPRDSSLRGSFLAAPFRMTVFWERFIGSGAPRGRRTPLNCKRRRSRNPRDPSTAFRSPSSLHSAQDDRDLECSCCAKNHP